MLCMFKVLWELTSDRIDFSNATNGTYISDVKINICLLITETRRTTLQVLSSHWGSYVLKRMRCYSTDMYLKK